MILQFIIGGPGSGKTTHCLNAINDALNNHLNRRIIYLVPEQFSLQSERALVSSRYRAALTNIKVLSFNRLAYNLLSELGVKTGKVMDDLGKHMLLRKVLFDIDDDLMFYKNAMMKKGFIDSLSQTITELTQHRITAIDLSAKSQQQSEVLKAKMLDVSLIFKKYKETIRNRFLLPDEMLEVLCQSLDDPETECIDLLDGAEVWVDGFSGFSPSELEVLKHILKRVTKLTITLTSRDRQDFTDELSQIPRDTMTQLIDIAKQVKAECLPIMNMEVNHRHIHAPGLKHFTDSFYVHDAAQYANQKNITLIHASDKYAAVYETAILVCDLVKHHRMDYQDIALLCADKTTYEKIIVNTFERYHIPVFIDTEVSILMHPLTELIRSLLDMYVHHFSQESVFRFLKTGFTNFSADEIDLLENYVIAHGTVHYKWLYHFSDARIDTLRIKFMEQLEPVSKLRNKHSAEDFTRILVDFLLSLNIPDQLLTRYDQSIINEEHEQARRHKQIWPKICSIFDKLVEMLGDVVMDVQLFAQILDAGFSQASLGIIPPTMNQIIVGDAQRSRYPQIKAMIVLGANDGMFPAHPIGSGLFTDFERELLINSALNLSEGNIHRIREQYYGMFCALSQPSEKLMLITTETEPGGKPMKPAAIVKMLKELYPTIGVHKAHTFHEAGIDYNGSSFEILSNNVLTKLFPEEVSVSASRLEAYVRCPFQYYVHYLLKIKPREKFEVLPADLGEMYHGIISAFSSALKKNSDYQYSEIKSMVADYVQQNIDKSSIYQDSARNEFVLKRVINIAARSIWALCQQLRRGNFNLVHSELQINQLDPFILPNGKQLKLRGIIDRVDKMSFDANELIKIIDYKSGQAKFNIHEVRLGLQLQLMLYMNIILSNMQHTGVQVKPAGLFYFPISDPIVDADKYLSDEQRDDQLLKKFQLSGLIIDDAVSELDNTLSPGNDSLVIPAKINKDGRFSKSNRQNIVSAPDFEALSKEVDGIIKNIGQRITCGEIMAKPLIYGTKNPCVYCDFSSICGMSR